jgi:hypothetical protein
MSVIEPAMMLSECRLKNFGCEKWCCAFSGLKRMAE